MYQSKVYGGVPPLAVSNAAPIPVSQAPVTVIVYANVFPLLNADELGVGDGDANVLVGVDVTVGVGVSVFVTVGVGVGVLYANIHRLDPLWPCLLFRKPIPRRSVRRDRLHFPRLSRGKSDRGLSQLL